MGTDDSTGILVLCLVLGKDRLCIRRKTSHNQKKLSSGHQFHTMSVDRGPGIFIRSIPISLS